MVVIYDSDIKLKNNESDSEYIQRMCSTKDINNLSWKKLASLINATLGYSFSESYYRRNFQKGNFITFPEVEITTSATNIAIDEDTYDVDESYEELFELKKERVKIAEERAQNRAYVRSISREETIKEIAHDYATLMNDKKKLPTVTNVVSSSSDLKAGILLLSDWHYGMTCDNYWNTFDPDVCISRVRKLLDRVITVVKTQKLSSVTVMNLSDLIAGRIHAQIRIESRFDVITQTMEVAEILAEFLTELSTCCCVDYYDCLDNHSRIEPNKSASLDLESLVRIIPWYLKERVEDNANINIHDNEFGADIITCEVLGHNIIGVHGDNDRPTTALEKLSLMTHRHYEMLCTAHLHHFQMDEQHQSLVVSNGSLMGVDNYAEKLRLTSDPSQTLLVVTPENVCECVYRIRLN